MGKHTQVGGCSTVGLEVLQKASNDIKSSCEKVPKSEPNCSFYLKGDMFCTRHLVIRI